jgi:SAM-dependent methyltransferase
MHLDHVDDARFVHDFTRLIGDEPAVLELGCGTGRLMAPMLDAGARVTGLDASPSMLAIARTKLVHYGALVSLVAGDMRHFNLQREFDLVVVGLNTFMHLLTISDQLATLECAHRHLRPAGLIMIDLPNPHAVMRDMPLGVVLHRFTRPSAMSPDVSVTLWSSTVVESALQLTHTTLFFDEVEAGQSQTRRLTSEVTLRLIYRYELEHMLARSGFSLRNLHGDYESSPYEDDSERMIGIAAAHA